MVETENGRSKERLPGFGVWMMVLFFFFWMMVLLKIFQNVNWASFAMSLKLESWTASSIAGLEKSSIPLGPWKPEKVQNPRGLGSLSLPTGKEEETSDQSNFLSVPETESPTSWIPAPALMLKTLLLCVWFPGKQLAAHFKRQYH